MSSFIVGSFASEPLNQEREEVWKPHPWLSTTFVGERTDAGIRITPEKAMAHTPFWHGLLLLAGDVGSLDIQLMQRRGDRMVENMRHNAYNLAAVRPHQLMCPNNFWEIMMMRAIVWGNSLAEIIRFRNGTPAPVSAGGGFQPLPPETTTREFTKDGKLWITTRFTRADGTQEKRFIDPFNTLHIKNLTSDGFWGRDLVAMHRNRIANGLGMVMAHNRFMGQGMNPDWLFVFPEIVDEEDRNSYERQLQQRNKGIANTGNSLVLDRDVKATQLGMDLRMAQFEQLMRLDILMVASLLGIPANMLNAMQSMTFNNVEESEKHYINRTLRRWLNKITQELRIKLFTPSEQERFKFQFNLDPLLMGKLSERYAAYNQAIASRILNPNEVRALEGFNPYEGGDEFLNPNTTSGGGPSEGADNPEDRRLYAKELERIVRREDNECEKACRREKNINQWLDGFYNGKLFNELVELVPNVAENYCSSRNAFWQELSGKVTSAEALGEMVVLHRVTQGDRVAGLLNREFIGA